MPPDADISSIAHVIGVAVAPVFLLTGVASFLGVLTNRLARIIDRARELEAAMRSGAEIGEPDLHGGILHMARRARLVNRAISMCTTCALLICLVIVLLFVGAIASIDVSTFIAVLFIAAMAFLTAGLIIFLREIYIGTATLRIGPQEPLRRADRPASAHRG